MATSAQLQATTSNGSYVHTLTATVVGQDTVANTTRVHYEYWVHSNRTFANGAWTFLHNVTFHAVVGGVDHTNAPDFDFRVRKDWLMVSGDQTIANNADGSLNITLALSCNALPTTYFIAISASGVTLPANPIPRASKFTVTPNPVVAGGEVAITIDRASGSFTHDITWVSNASSGTIGTGVATTATWTPDPALLGGGVRVPITITVVTKNGLTVIGTTSLDIFLRAAPVYPEIGVGTPYDLRLRRTEMDGSDWVVRESIPFLEATITDTMSASGSCKIKVSKLNYAEDLDGAVVVANVYDGSQWIPDGLVFFLSRAEGDKTDDAQTATYTGMSYAEYILSKGLVEADREWPVSTPGAILSEYIATAKTRGWGPKLVTNFSAAVTSIGTPWTETTDLDTTTGLPFSQLLDGFVDDSLVEYRSYFDADAGNVVLEMFNPGYGSDWAVRGADPIINISTAGLFKSVDAAPVRKDFSEKLTRVTIKGDEASATRESASAVNPMFGHLEGTVTATGVKDPTRLNQLGDAALINNASATVERTFTYDLSSTQTSSALYPYRTFRPGDWILIPGDLGPERSRVSQVAITRSADGTKATITVGDMIPNGIAAIARKQTQAGGGAIAGGTLQSPLPLSSAIPAAPVGLDGVSGGYWDETGAPKSGMQLTWSPVIASLAGTSITVDLYEVWTRAEEGAPWSLAVLSDVPTVNLAPLDINTTFDIRVRGRSLAGVYGAFSDFITETTDTPTVDLDGPVITDLYTDGVGNIFVVWAGYLGSDPAPARLAYVVAEVSVDGGTTYTTEGTPIVGAGTLVLNKNGFWGDYLVRLRGYDRLGNAGDASAPEAITLSDPHIDPATPIAPVNLAATVGAAWDASGYLPEAWIDLTWDAVDEDTDGNPIEVVGYDVLGLRSDESVERFLTTTGTNAARMIVGNGETWTYRVRATSNFGGVGAPSDSIDATANATISAAAAPAAPTLDQYAGHLRIQWSGGGMVPQIKYVYATIASSSGGPYVRAGMPLSGAGEIVVPGLATDADYWAKIVMVDELGTTSVSAAAGPIHLLPITGVTIQTSEVANTGIKITSGSLTAYNASGNPTFVLNAETGEVWIAPYDAVFDLGASGHVATTGSATTGIAISSENSSFNTFIHPSGVQIRNDQDALSWWEADASDAGLVNFFSPRAAIGTRLRVGDYEMLRESKTVGSRLVIRYRGA